MYNLYAYHSTTPPPPVSRGFFEFCVLLCLFLVVNKDFKIVMLPTLMSLDYGGLNSERC